MSLTIDQFIWAYQHYYRSGLKITLEMVLQRAGFVAECQALVVGFLRPGAEARHPVCVEPENDRWDTSLFENLAATVDEHLNNHPRKDMFYGDEMAMRDKPEGMLRDAVRGAVVECLQPYDVAVGVTSFGAPARPIGDYLVVPVVQVPTATLSRVPSLNDPIGDGRYHVPRSLIHAVIEQVLDVAVTDLESPEPGRRLNGGPVSPSEILNRAARKFMYAPFQAVSAPFGYDFFNVVTSVAALPYEGASSVGSLLLCNPDNPILQFDFRFRQPIPLSQHRWVRKALEMSSPGISVVTNGEHLLGVGSLSGPQEPGAQDTFEIEFLGHHLWRLKCADRILLHHPIGKPSLPPSPIDEALFKDNIARIFPGTSSDSIGAVWSVVDAAHALGHGTMIVVAADAAEEAERLCMQGSAITPASVSKRLLRSACSIDGTVLIDPGGYCHAIGLILDGSASATCTPSRGSRYNSAARYTAGRKDRLAVVISDDRTTDVLPPLRRRLRRSDVVGVVEELESSMIDNYHQARTWLDANRFYLDQGLCERVNGALDRLKNEPPEVGRIWIVTHPFEQNPDLDDSFFIPE